MKSLKIKDPKTKRYVANLLPKQKLELIITDPNTSVTCSGMLLEKTSVYTNDKNQTVMVIEPVQNILKHSYLSNHYLGEVLIGTEYSLLIYLQSTLLNKKTITIINPFQECLRIKPYNIIEFMYCSEYDKDISWSWTYPSKGVSIDITELCYKKTITGCNSTKKYDDCYYAHPRELFVENSTVHHFWFKLSTGLLTEIQNNPSKNVEIGRLAVEGFNEHKEQDECFVDIYCDLLPKWTSEKKVKNKVIKSYHSDESRYDVDDTYNERIYSYKYDWSGYYNNKNHSNHRSLPQCATVNFSIISSDDIYEGCKTLDAKDLETEVKAEVDTCLYAGYSGYECY